MLHDHEGHPDAVTAHDRYDMLAAELAIGTTVARATLSGMPCLTYDGRPFAGFAAGAMAFRLDGAARDEALALAGAHLLDHPSLDQATEDWVAVPGAHADRWTALAHAALRSAGGPALPD